MSAVPRLRLGLYDKLIIAAIIVLGILGAISLVVGIMLLTVGVSDWHGS